MHKQLFITNYVYYEKYYMSVLIRMSTVTTGAPGRDGRDGEKGVKGEHGDPGSSVGE